MERKVVIDDKEYSLWEADKAVNMFCFASVIAQLIIILLNWFVFKHSNAVTAFLWGLQWTTLCLAIILFAISKHNNKIFERIMNKIEEDRKKMEDAKNVKKAPKKPRKNVKKETNDGAK